MATVTFSAADDVLYAYLAGEIDRTQTLEGIAKAWSDYAANN